MKHKQRLLIKLMIEKGIPENGTIQDAVNYFLDLDRLKKDYVIVNNHLEELIKKNSKNNMTEEDVCEKLLNEMNNLIKGKNENNIRN